jgi:signal transduction histidine kinase
MAESPESQVGLIIVIGSGGMLLLAVAIVLFVTYYQKRMVQEQLKQKVLEGNVQERVLEATLESQERERQRVASDLHDSIGGMLSAIRIGLSTLSRQLPDPTRLDVQKQMLDDTIESVRKISRDLMPATLEKFGLVPAIRELGERLQLTTSIQIGIIEIGEFQKMDSKREIMIYRIIQELLNNAIKHAQATYLEVIFEFKEKLYLIVEDNGVGFDPRELEVSGRKSLGLYNITSRAKLLGAHIQIEHEKKDGTKILVIVPYEPQT